MNTHITPTRVATPTERGARTPICCPIVTGKQLARIDFERRLLYLWCKACKGWHEYDLEVLEEQHASAVESIA